MSLAPRCVPRPCGFLIIITAFFALPLAAEPLPLRRAVELALAHSTTAASANADQQRVFASYREARNQYIPQFILGSGLGKSWGFPLSLEGSAPSIVNLNSQSVLFNPSLRDFVRAAKTDWNAATLQTKDQRNQVIQDTVLSYAELSKWEALLGHLQEEHAAALQTEQQVSERIKEGVDSPIMQNKVHLSTARLRLRLAEAQGAIDVIRNRLSHLTGLPAAGIETESDSMPPLPEVKQEADLAGRAAQISPGVQAAESRAAAESLRARGEHRAMLPSMDFAAQYGLLAAYNNYQNFFQPGSFQRHNATLGVVIKFPLFSPTLRARADAADALASKARKDAESVRNQVSEETLRLQRSVEQMAVAKEVADLEYQVAQSNLEALRVRVDAGSAAWHDVQDAREQVNERYNSLQDANFELERARITLLRATGELANWVGAGQ
ncbi:MAG: TolC family protein [Terriglobales bacterium]